MTDTKRPTTPRLGLRLPSLEHHDLVKREARRRHVTVSEFLRDLIADELERHHRIEQP